MNNIFLEISNSNHINADLTGFKKVMNLFKDVEEVVSYVNFYKEGENEKVTLTVPSNSISIVMSPSVLVKLSYALRKHELESTSFEYRDSYEQSVEDEIASSIEGAKSKPDKILSNSLTDLDRVLYNVLDINNTFIMSSPEETYFCISEYNFFTIPNDVLLISILKLIDSYEEIAKLFTYFSCTNLGKISNSVEQKIFFTANYHMYWDKYWIYVVDSKILRIIHNLYDDDKSDDKEINDYVLKQLTGLNYSIAKVGKLGFQFTVELISKEGIKYAIPLEVFNKSNEPTLLPVTELHVTKQELYFTWVDGQRINNNHSYK